MLHPDKNPSVAADGAFKLIRSAHDILTNPEKRKAYDGRFSRKKAKNAVSSGSRTPTTDDKKFSRDGSHKATNASSGFTKTKPPGNCSSRRKTYSARVVTCDRDGRRKIIITRNCKDKEVRFGSNTDSSLLGIVFLMQSTVS
ncbi:DnaJ domain [Melia azedarach]|uniref:DnaJ domain n=1 Tax=Melia azedarach TaxID=155640 RepID=A0ACC1WVU5_MELAZ|nr:DnaJ domain [Melia azedarach]